MMGSVQQRDRGAIAMPEQPGTHQAQLREQGRHYFPGLAVHEVGRPALIWRARRRAPVAVAREHQAAQAVGAAELLGKVLPLRDRAEALVQEDHDRRAGSGHADPGEFEPQRLAVPVDVGKRR
jgi:hypothetical protein